MTKLQKQNGAEGAVNGLIGQEGRTAHTPAALLLLAPFRRFRWVLFWAPFLKPTIVMVCLINHVKAMWGVLYTTVFSGTLIDTFPGIFGTLYSC